MKRNITINMFGQLYAIDEDAYKLLKCYIDSMKRYFAEKEGGEEIADDIEHRVAELLWQKKQEGTVAISIEIVKDIICKIGNPAEIDVSDGEESAYGKTSEEAEGDAEEKNDEATRGKSLFDSLKGRYLYRDPDDKVLGGVCAGLATFTGLYSSMGWRLGAILLFCVGWWIQAFVNMPLSMFIPILYVVMWIIVPLPNTPEDRIRMKGQSVTPESLNEEIIHEVETRNAGVSHSRNNGGCLSLMLKVVLALCLLPCIFAFGLLVLTLLFVISIWAGMYGSMFPVIFDGGDDSWVSGFLDGNVTTMAVGVLAAFVVIGLPLYAIVKTLRGNGGRMKASGIITYIFMWIICLCITVFCCISLGMNAEKSSQDYWHRIYKARQTNTVDNDTTVVQHALSTDNSAVDTVGWSE